MCRSGPRLSAGVAFVLACLVIDLSRASGQTSTATLSGVVVDGADAVIPSVAIVLTNDSTALKREVTTNANGFFTVPLLPPGSYTLRARRDGFTPAEIRALTLNVNDQIALRIQLKVAPVGETVTVLADTARLNTSPAVGTVVDRQFVSNLPLNGRSFQSLLELTPGVVIAPSAAGNAGGQFSVNGQRSTTNYVTVDGVSANSGIAATTTGLAGASGSGQLPALSAQGSTASLVSVDALEEFRIQTSSYAPEFGRQPGGQVTLITRSGSNAFSGTAYDYVRNEALDANDWFANRNSLPKPPTRQHQFGGTLGGPVYLPRFGGDSHWYSGKNRTFFFVSHESLRLRLPKSTEATVPTPCFRGASLCPPGQSAAPPQFQPFLRAFPVPNGREVGSGFAVFAASYADPSRYDATALRIDHQAGRATFFARASRTPSRSSTRQSLGLSYTTNTRQNNTSVTAGLTWVIGKTVFNDVRVNHSTTDGPVTFEPDTFGGALPLEMFGFRGLSPDVAFFSMTLASVPSPTTALLFQRGTSPSFRQRQLNVVDTLTLTRGDHQVKFGLDFRRSSPVMLGGGPGGSEAVAFTLAQLSNGQVQSVSQTAFDGKRHVAVFDNVSLYAQDAWSTTRRLTLTYGIRWEFVPPPHAAEGPDPITLDGLDNPLLPDHVAVAATGTPLWTTRRSNFAPRVGASYLIRDRSGRELMVRGGTGIFFDLGLGSSTESFGLTWPNFARIGYPIAGTPCQAPLSFPLPACTLTVPPIGTDPPVQLFIMDRDIELPRTYQWNVSAEQSIGAHQAITVSYVGAAGRKLLSTGRYNGIRLRGIAYSGAASTSVLLQQNLGFSDYRALQIQFRRRLNRGLQALVSYTLSESLDTESADNLGSPIEAFNPNDEYGHSSFDVRHILTAAATYQPPPVSQQPLVKLLTGNWGVDVMFRARSGFPLGVTTSIPVPPLFGTIPVRPNVVAGQPFWIDDPTAPQGRRLNLAAFNRPADGTQGNLPKGVIRGFGAKQIDLSLRRQFPLVGRTRMQLRLEAFNLFNWPNFADPNGSFSTTSRPDNFGASTQMLNRALGGLNALYQIGGPRSMQAAVRISF